MPSVVLLSIPGLREDDLAHMPQLAALCPTVRPLDPVFPALTLPAQATLSTGTLPSQHGVVGNGFYWRDRDEVEMWTAWNDVVQRPAVWNRVEDHRSDDRTMVWFPLLAKGAHADFICTPAPIHNPDGSESLWCYTQPEAMYGELRDQLGHFPLHKFWGPLAGIEGSDWIARSAAIASQRFRPHISYIYLPHLDYKAQSHGPDSAEHAAACGELDAVIAGLVADWHADDPPCWLVASEYAISPVERVGYPNRILREAGFLDPVTDDDGGEQLAPGRQRAWAMCDHQIGHVFVRDSADIAAVADLLEAQPEIDQVLTASQRGALDHCRSGDIVLVAQPDAWLAYYWWLDDANAPAFARTVDIHRKPGYDPVEMFLEPGTRSTPLDATLVKGSHGRSDVPGLLASSQPDWLPRDRYHQTDVAGLLLGHFGLSMD